MDTQTNALAEIALALAMAFFSIMVLAFVSMGAGRKVSSATVMVEPPVALASSVTATVHAPSGQQAGTAVSAAALVLHHRGRFYSGGLKPLSDEQVRKMSLLQDGIVVAVAPDLSLSEALQIRKRVSGENVTVTTQTTAWITALKETVK